MTDAANAIDTSIVENRTVWLEWSIDDESDLLVECEDSVEYDSADGLVREFWGNRHGNEWRVHLVRPIAA